MRDVLYLLELVCAVKDGDFGRVEDILPHLAMIYRGAGSNNYCAETLYMIQNLKYIWTPELGYVLFCSKLRELIGIQGYYARYDDREPIRNTWPLYCHRYQYGVYNSRC
jgi:hypothetical protein